MQLNGTTLEIHTAAKEFIFNKDCRSMFGTFNGTTKFANITTINFNGCINTSKVTIMSQMFYQCRALNSLDLSNFNTANVTDMSYMFSQCLSLKSLDIRNFDMGKVNDSDYMFSSVGELNNTGNKTSIMVTTNLWKVLKSMNVSTGSYADYDIVDNMPS